MEADREDLPLFELWTGTPFFLAGREKRWMARLRAYLHDRHALLADISARNEGHAPTRAWCDLKA